MNSSYMVSNINFVGLNAAVLAVAVIIFLALLLRKKFFPMQRIIHIRIFAAVSVFLILSAIVYYALCASVIRAQPQTSAAHADTQEFFNVFSKCLSSGKIGSAFDPEKNSSTIVQSQKKTIPFSGNQLRFSDKDNEGGFVFYVKEKSQPDGKLDVYIYHEPLIINHADESGKLPKATIRLSGSTLCFGYGSYNLKLVNFVSDFDGTPRLFSTYFSDIPSSYDALNQTMVYIEVPQGTKIDTGGNSESNVTIVQ